MFIVNLTYIRPIEEIEARTADHRAWLDQHIASGLLLATGPKVPRTGGILVVSGQLDREALMAVLAEDPFQRHGLAEYEVIEFKAVKHNPALASLI